MFVYIVHADNISDYVGFKKQKKRVRLNPVKLGLAQTPHGGVLTMNVMKEVLALNG